MNQQCFIILVINALAYAILFVVYQYKKRCFDIGSIILLEWNSPNINVLHSVSIATGSVVKKDVEQFAIVGGIPAKKIGERNHNLLYDFSGNYVPFY